MPKELSGRDRVRAEEADPFSHRSQRNSFNAEYQKIEADENVYFRTRGGNKGPIEMFYLSAQPKRIGQQDLVRVGVLLKEGEGKEIGANEGSFVDFGFWMTDGKVQDETRNGTVVPGRDIEFVQEHLGDVMKKWAKTYERNMPEESKLLSGLATAPPEIKFALPDLKSLRRTR